MAQRSSRGLPYVDELMGLRDRRDIHGQRGEENG